MLKWTVRPNEGRWNVTIEGRRVAQVHLPESIEDWDATRRFREMLIEAAGTRNVELSNAQHDEGTLVGWEEVEGPVPPLPIFGRF
jgi:hypothetical protein